MEKNSSVRFIDAGAGEIEVRYYSAYVQLLDDEAGRTLVRYYNAKKDCFERIGTAEQVFVLGLSGKGDSADKLMVLDARIWLLWGGCLHYVGPIDAGLIMEQWGNGCVRCYELYFLPVPFDEIIVSFEEFEELEPQKWVPTSEYRRDGNQIIAKEYSSGRKICFEFSRDVLSDL